MIFREAVCSTSIVSSKNFLCDLRHERSLTQVVRLFPIESTDPSLGTFYLEHVPPPRKGKNYIAFICAREKIHVSRVKLYVNEGSELMGEERLRLVDRDEILRRGPNECGASSTNPLMITVEMSADSQGC